MLMVAQLVEHQVVGLKVEGSIPFHQPNKRILKMGPDFIALFIWKYGLQIILIYTLFQ